MGEYLDGNWSGLRYRAGAPLCIGLHPDVLRMDDAEDRSAEDAESIALAISEAHSDDEAAVAYALYLAHHTKHDIPTGMIHLNQHETAWNTKSTGMNNVGF